MTDLMDVMAEAKSALQPLAEDVEITGTETCDDCTAKVEIHVSNLKDAPTCNESEIGESGASDDTRDEQAEQTDDTKSTDAMGGGKDQTENPEKAWDTVAYNVKSTVARVFEEETGVSRPDKLTEANLTEWFEELPVEPTEKMLKAKKIDASTAEAVIQRVSDDNTNDEETTTPDAGGWSKAKVDGRDIYTVNGEKYTVNGLRSEVSDMNVEYNKHWTGEDMAEMVAEGGSAGNSDDSGNSSDDSTDGVSEETVKGRGVPAEYAETVAKHLSNGRDECTTEGCAMAANKNSTVCYWCDAGKVSPAMSGAGDDSDDRGDEIQEVVKMFDCSPKVAEDSIEAVESGHFETTKKAVDHFA